MAAKLDAIIVGAGFGGIYQLHSLVHLGLSVKLIDKSHGVGGTWYWNRYPGAVSDTESFAYRISWDKEDLQAYALVGTLRQAARSVGLPSARREASSSPETHAAQH